MPRKQRTLVRDKATFRDDRLIIVACDDTYAPEQYFNFFRMTRVQVQVIPSSDGLCAASDVLARLKEYEVEPDDERWLLLDTDHYIKPSHLPSFTAALREAKQANIKIALSRPCFELWLLLHHESDISACTSLNTAAKVIKALRKKLDGYNKLKLKSEHFPLALVRVACERAHNLDLQTGGGEIPDGVTTRVYRLWQAILALGSVPKSEQ